MLNIIHGNQYKWLVSFVTAALSSVMWPMLPKIIWLPGFVLLAMFIYSRRYGPWCSGALIGMVWMASVGHWQVSWQLPHDEILNTKHVTGVIETVVTDAETPRFNLRLTHINGYSVYSAPRIRLSWRHPHWPPKQGLKASFDVKLKPIHGLANEGGFRYQQWLIAQRIVATGYVRSAKLDGSPYAESRRQSWLTHLYSLPLQHAPWIAALTYGDKSRFSDADWQLIQHTGIAHLVAISGLHLGIVALITLLICRVSLRLIICISPLPQGFNYRFATLMIVLMVTWYYAFLAGFSLPTVRAWCMLLLLSVLILMQRFVNPARFIVLSLAGFLIIQPLSVLSLSFWLSFGAIMAIGMIVWRWPNQSGAPSVHHEPSVFLLKRAWRGIKAMCLLQLALSTIMLPLVASQFSVVSFQSPLINLIAIPVVTFCLVPLCLLAGIVLPVNARWAEPLFQLIDWLLEICLTALPSLETSQLTNLSLPAIPAVVWVFVLMYILVCFMPLKVVKKASATVLLLPLFSYSLPAKNTKWQMHVLDVGQGTSIIIQQHNKVMVYDVGSRFPSGFNMADAVLLPFLQSKGIADIDWLLISHFDNDHAGSLPDVLNGIQVNQFASNHDLCRAGWQMDWHQLHIEVLWPSVTNLASRNDNSCVVRISDGQHAVLLAGDISARVEKNLVKTHVDGLEADVLLAAHHGSNTSSSGAFIDAVAPQFAVFSQGFMNQWDFPKQPVVNRFVKANVVLYSTASSGQITFEFDPSQPQITTQTFRQDMLATWYNRYLWDK